MSASDQLLIIFYFNVFTHPAVFFLRFHYFTVIFFVFVLFTSVPFKTHEIFFAVTEAYFVNSHAARVYKTSLVYHELTGVET